MKRLIAVSFVLLSSQVFADRSMRDDGTVVALPDDVLVASAPALDETFPSDLTPIFRWMRRSARTGRSRKTV